MIGYRLWLVDGARLRSIACHHDWKPGVQKAFCTVGGGGNHDSPTVGCTCGLWMRTGVMELSSMIIFSYGNETLLLGAVEAWGRIIEHDKGFRCQFMRALCFLDQDPLWPLQVPYTSSANIERVSVVHDVPVVRSMAALRLAVE